MAGILVDSLQQIFTKAGLLPEESLVGILHPHQSLAGEIKTVGVERVVGAEGVQEQPLETAEVLHHVLAVRVLREGLVQFGLQTLSRGFNR